MAVSADRLRVAPAAEAAGTMALHRAALWGLLVSKFLAGWGVQWDIQWHVMIGRDSFWIAPHLMTYAGVALAVLLSWGVLARDSLAALRRGGASADRSMIRVLGVTGTRGFHLAAWGIALTVLAAPIDDLWHRLFGLDVTLWSPPHLLGIAGSAVNTLACLLIAREAFADRPGLRLFALVVSGGLLYGNLHLLVDPSNLVAYRRGGVFFYTLAVLSALVLPLALVATARASRTRWAPVLLLLVVIPTGFAGMRIAQAGFALLQPAPMSEAEISRDPDSPVAIARTIARKDRITPGRTGGVLHVVALLPALAMALVDPRRRPRLATAGYAAVLFVALTVLLRSRAALAPMAPAAPETAVALGLTLLAGVVGGGLAARIWDALDED